MLAIQPLFSLVIGVRANTLADFSESKHSHRDTGLHPNLKLAYSDTPIRSLASVNFMMDNLT